MFPLIETAIAFAAAMLAGSLFVSAVVQGLQSVGRYRAEIVERMLKSVFHGFRSFYNDKEVLIADFPELSKPKPSDEEIEKIRGRVLATEKEFVHDILGDPALHARADGVSYGGEPEKLAKLVEYIDVADLVTIARNHAESPAVFDESTPSKRMSDVTRASQPPPAIGSGEDDEAKRQLAQDKKLFLPAAWFFPKGEGQSEEWDAASRMEKSYATLANFADYVEHWFSTFEATSSQSFKKQIRRLTLVVSFTAVVLFNFDSFQLLSKLYADSGARETIAQRIPALQQQAQRLNIGTADVQPDPVSNPGEPDPLAEAGSLLSALDDPSLGLGWQGSPIVDKWCGYTAKCSKVGPKLSSFQIAGATISWLLGLIFSGVLLTLGAPFWYSTLAGLLNLKNAVQASKEATAKPKIAAKPKNDSNADDAP